MLIMREQHDVDGCHLLRGHSWAFQLGQRATRCALVHTGRAEGGVGQQTQAGPVDDCGRAADQADRRRHRTPRWRAAVNMASAPVTAWSNGSVDQAARART